MTKTQIAKQIKASYRKSHEAGEWMSVVDFAEQVDYTPTQIAEALIHLARTDDRFNLVPESNQKILTDMDHAYAVHFGGQEKHLYCWF